MSISTRADASSSEQKKKKKLPVVVPKFLLPTRKSVDMLISRDKESRRVALACLQNYQFIRFLAFSRLLSSLPPPDEHIINTPCVCTHSSSQPLAATFHRAIPQGTRDWDRGKRGETCQACIPSHTTFHVLTIVRLLFFV